MTVNNQPDNTGDNNNNSNSEGGGNDPANPPKPESKQPETGTVDFSQLSDGELFKVLEDPRLWKHERIKTIAEKAKKAREYEEAEEARKQEELKKAKKFDEVEATYKEKIGTLEGTVKDMRIKSAVSIEAVKTGVIDIDAVLKLMDLSGVDIDDNGNVTGVDTALSQLLESKPFLKGEPGKVQIGSPTNPGQNNSSSPARFKLSQLQDAEFYREHEKEIDEAVRLNLVEDDMS